MMQSIQELAAQLKLTYVRDNADETLLRARRTGQSAEELPGELFSFELERRSKNGNTRRIKEAHFPIKRYLVDFDRGRLYILSLK